MSKFNVEVACSVVQNLIKKYHRINEKRSKRNVPPLAEEEYCKKIEQDWVKSNTLLKVGILFVLGFYIALIVWTALDSILIDTMIFSVILVIVGFIFISPVVYGVKSRQKLINFLSINNKTIFDEDILTVIQNINNITRSL